ncbi:MAG: 50S ribosomal protein L24 [Patescibacteria group bacterium]
MSIARIQSGDQVKIISGKFKGTLGTVTKVSKSVDKRGIKRVRASISSVPKIAKFRKSSVYQGQKYPGMQTETDRLIDVSNLSLITADGKPSKVKIIVEKNGKKTRLLKKDGEVVVKNKLASKVDSKDEQKNVDHS